MGIAMRQPKPWIAAVLSLLGVGLGHVYAGRILQGVALAVIVFLVPLTVVAFGMSRLSPTMMVAPVGAILVLWVAAAVHAFRIAREPTTRFTTSGRVVVACLLFIAGTSAFGEILRAASEHFVGKTFRVPSGAMMPTLLIGDHFIADPSPFRGEAPRRGDIVTFHVARGTSSIHPVDLRPDLPTEVFIKRIVGIPGDIVRVDGAIVSINGKAVTGPILPETFSTPEGHLLSIRAEVLDDTEFHVLDDLDRESPPADHVVEPDRYFLLGDNRDNSLDSRIWGTIRRDAIIGRVSGIYWSWDFNGNLAGLLNPTRLKQLLQHGIRWDRIGLRP